MVMSKKGQMKTTVGEDQSPTERFYFLAGLESDNKTPFLKVSYFIPDKRESIRLNLNFYTQKTKAVKQMSLYF